MLQSDLKLLLGFIKNSKDEDTLSKYINTHNGFDNIDILIVFKSSAISCCLLLVL